MQSVSRVAKQKQNTSTHDARRAAYIMRRPTETKSLKVVLRCGWSVSVYLETVKFWLRLLLSYTKNMKSQWQQRQ
jgi:hypothetical protein